MINTNELKRRVQKDGVGPTTEHFLGRDAGRAFVL